MFKLHVSETSKGTQRAQTLRVVFPLRGRAREATGADIPEKWGKIAKCPTPKMGKITGKLQKLYFRSNFTLFWGNFPRFRGSDRGGKFCNFSIFFRGFPPRWLPGPSKGKNNSQPKRSFSLTFAHASLLLENKACRKQRQSQVI